MIYTIFIGAFLIALLVWANNLKKQKILAQQNELQTKIIRELENDRKLLTIESVLKGQEEERARLAKDIHDGLGGILSSIKYMLSSIGPESITDRQGRENMTKSISLLDSANEELRRIAHNMMPESVVKFGIDEALRAYCLKLSSEKCSIHYMSFGLEQVFDQAKQIVVYRIVQELMNNSLKHSRATKLLVQISREKNMIIVTVEDNGVGFNYVAITQGIGLKSIDDRVNYLGGKMNFDSRLGVGTIVTIEFYV